MGRGVACHEQGVRVSSAYVSAREVYDMNTALRIVGTMVILASALLLSSCSWTTTLQCKIGSGDCDIIVKGSQSAAPELLATALTVDASSIYIDTTGTDFNLGSTGMTAVTLRDSSGGIIAAKAFAWIRSGNNLVFQNPNAVQSWADGYPNAASADATVAAAGIPVDGTSHTLSSAVYYSGVKEASASRSFPAECWSRYHTQMLCAQ
jgi:hypothetical protein